MIRETRDGSPTDRPFHVERRGIDVVPDAERWASARDIGALWSGSSINIAYVIYGALLLGFGFSLPVAIGLIVLGNASYLLVAVASLQGPQTGTTTFAITRAPFGRRGARALSALNWITQVGFETEALLLVVGASITLSQLAGIHVGAGLKVTFIVAACLVQTVLPYFGHATMVKVLRLLIVPFVAIFAVVAFVGLHHVRASYHGVAGGWELESAGLAFVVALSGLGWSECGNDYTRYVAPTTSTRSLVGWIMLGTALPEAALMILGALLATFLGSIPVWNGSNPFAAFSHTRVLPTWLVAALLVIAIVQMFSIDALVLYSSGVSLLATGLPIKRYQAVVVDGVLAGLLTIWATFQSSFSAFTKEFVGVIIIWIGPWFGVFVMDWLLRGRRYDDGVLDGLATRDGAGRWAGGVAMLAGMVVATMAFSKAPPPASVPFHWMTPIANHFGSFYCPGTASAGCGPAGWFGGADFSAPGGIIVAALCYAALVRLGAARARLSLGRVRSRRYTRGTATSSQ